MFPSEFFKCIQSTHQLAEASWGLGGSCQPHGRAHFLADCMGDFRQLGRIKRDDLFQQRNALIMAGFGESGEGGACGEDGLYRVCFTTQRDDSNRLFRCRIDDVMIARRDRINPSAVDVKLFAFNHGRLPFCVSQPR